MIICCQQHPVTSCPPDESLFNFTHLSKLVRLKNFFLPGMFLFCFGLSMYSCSERLHLFSWLPCSMVTLAKGSQARPYGTAACLVWVHILLSLVLFINLSFPHRAFSLVHFNWYQRDRHLTRPIVPPQSLIPACSTANRLCLTCRSRSRSRSRSLFLQVRVGLGPGSWVVLSMNTVYPSFQRTFMWGWSMGILIRNKTTQLCVCVHTEQTVFLWFLKINGFKIKLGNAVSIFLLSIS